MKNESRNVADAEPKRPRGRPKIYGGRIALRLAPEHPDEIERALLDGESREQFIRTAIDDLLIKRREG